MEECHSFNGVETLEYLIPIIWPHVIHTLLELQISIFQWLLWRIVCGCSRTTWRHTSLCIGIQLRFCLAFYRQIVRISLITSINRVSSWYSASGVWCNICSRRHWTSSSFGYRRLLRSSSELAVYLLLGIFLYLNGLHKVLVTYSFGFDGSIDLILKRSILPYVWISILTRVAISKVVSSRIWRLSLFVGRVSAFLIIIIARVIYVCRNVAQAKWVMSLLWVYVHLPITTHHHVVICVGLDSGLLTSKTSCVVFTVSFLTSYAVLYILILVRVIKWFHFVHFLLRRILIFKGAF